MLGQNAHVRVGFERDPASKHLVHDDAERVEVGSMVDVVARCLLRAHVVRRSVHHPRARETPRTRHLGDTEVEHFDDVVAGDVDVVRLEIAVHDAGGVRCAQRGRDLLQETERANGGGLPLRSSLLSETPSSSSITK
jgi:hypothetical protein